LGLVACKSHDEGIDKNLIGQWGGEHGPVYAFYENGKYEQYPDTRVNGRYTTKNNKITFEPSIRFRDITGDKFVLTYSIEGDTLTLSSNGSARTSYTRLK